MHAVRLEAMPTKKRGGDMNGTRKRFFSSCN